MGLCNCPTGFEDPQCGTLSINRYLGTYVGYTKCDMLSATIDSVFITQGSNGILSVDVKINSIQPKILHGYVSSNVTIYSILVTNNDSIISHPVDTSVYTREFTIDRKSVV